MSDKARDLTLERIDRMQQSILDLMEGQKSTQRTLLRAIDLLSGRVETLGEKVDAIGQNLTRAVREQALIANRFEEAFTRVLRRSMSGRA